VVGGGGGGGGGGCVFNPWSVDVRYVVDRVALAKIFL